MVKINLTKVSKMRIAVLVLLILSAIVVIEISAGGGAGTSCCNNSAAGDHQHTDMECSMTAMAEPNADIKAEKQMDKAPVEQTLCPVLGGQINKELFTEYRGKKVYFCCAMCESAFNKDPEKYIAKLPQFAK